MSQVPSTFDFTAHGWWSGAAAPATPGAQFTFVFRATAVAERLGIVLEDEELTGYACGLVTTGFVDLGGETGYYTFSDGELFLFRDATRNAVFAPEPPNASVPATFLDGRMCEKGTLRGLFVFTDLTTDFGLFEARATFGDEGCLISVISPSATDLGISGSLGAMYPAIPGYAWPMHGSVAQETLPFYVGLPGFAITSWDIPEVDDPSDSPFRIAGEFLEDTLQPSLDRCRTSVRLRIGSVRKDFPQNQVREQPLAATRIWRYSDSSQTAGIHTATLELVGNRFWRFEIVGRGIPRVQLLREDRVLDVEMWPAPWYFGRDQVVIEPISTGSGAARSGKHGRDVLSTARAVAWSRIKQFYR